MRSWDITLLDNKQPFGGVSAGSITVVCKLAIVEIEKPNISNISSKMSFRTSSGLTPANDPLLQIRWDHQVDYIKGSALYFIPLQVRWLDPTTSSTSLSSLSPFVSVVGLLLMAAEGQETTKFNEIPGLPSRFKRVGILSMGRGGVVEALILALHFCDNEYHHLLAETCEEVEIFGIGNKAFEITII